MRGSEPLFDDQYDAGDCTLGKQTRFAFSRSNFDFGRLIEGQPLLATILVALVAQLNVYFIVLLFAIESQPQEGKKAKQHGEQTLSSLLGRFALAALLYMANGALANIGDVFAGNVMFL